MKDSLKEFYIDVALRTAKLSKARRLQVGCIVVKDDKIISFGYNGTLPGKDNNCEHETIIYDVDDFNKLRNIAMRENYNDDHIFMFNGETYQIRSEIDKTGYLKRRFFVKLTTKPGLLHAEYNAIGKLAKSSESANGSAIFMTHSPCEKCAELMLVAGIKELYYINKYRTDEGIKLLQENNVYVEQFEREY